MPNTAHRSTHRHALRRAGTIAGASLAVLLSWATVASAATVQVVRGDTFSQLVQAHCGTSNWQGADFGDRDKNLIYAGETIDFTCPDQVSDTKAAAVEPAAAQAPVQLVSASGWFDPLPDYGPGACDYWQDRGSYNHKGEDIGAPQWTPIRAAHSGSVSTKTQIWYDNYGNPQGAGNYTVITGSDGVATVYMHQVAWERTSGWINGGEILGYVGSTGGSSGPHLHFEVHPWGAWNGVTNPNTWMRDHGASIGNC